MDLYLIRHTRPEVETGVCYGHLDVPLASGHAEECRDIVGRLPDLHMVWTSPLARCRALADVITLHASVSRCIDGRLCELHFGGWEGQRWAALNRTEVEQWAANYWNVAPPGGETYRRLRKRVLAVLKDIVRAPGSRIAVVTHAGPIRVILSHCLRLAPERYFDISLHYGGINLIQTDGADWRLAYVNG